MVNFLCRKPILYNRKRKDYSDKARKDKLWEDQASVMGHSIDTLKHWFEEMRTRYGRLTKRYKLGSGVISLTERDTWIMHSCALLAEHIVRYQGTPCVSLKVKIVAGSSSRPTLPHIDKEDEETEEEEQLSKTEVLFCEPLEQPRDPVQSNGEVPETSAVPAPAKKKNSHDEKLFNLLKNRRDASPQVRTQLGKLMEQCMPQGNREGWISWMGAPSTDIHEEHWFDFQQEFPKSS